MDAYLADKSPDAYEKQVDRLLASPHYGERWARPWLDFARYADTNGYEKDDRRIAWKYRDWVINALNQDMSFKEFTIEQIGGDMLPHPTQGQLIATGFNRNTLLNEEGGIDPEEFHWYSLIDRVNTTASVWLGLRWAARSATTISSIPSPRATTTAFWLSSTTVSITSAKAEHRQRNRVLELPTPDQAEQARS